MANKRSKDLIINKDMSVQTKIEPGKVKIIVLDGHQGKAKMCDAVEHGLTVIETAKGKAARIRYEESELF
jgi:hypothetical protein